jgi:phosphatidylglycerol:prolipoprotein diacylglycerol transferase
MSLVSLATAAAGHIHFTALGLSPVAFHIGPLPVRWYSLGYIGGIMIGWWWLTRLIRQPGAPMARQHADDFVFYATLGILLGGRIGYVLFYNPWMLRNPIEVLRLWDGGMSFHGGAIGTLIAIILLCRRNGLSILRFCDYMACVSPPAFFLVRIANFINGELWGRITDVPWAVVFPGAEAGPYPRHPSQLYEAGLEGIMLFAILNFMFWRTRARFKPGLLLGVFLIGYGVSRFMLEFVRQPDEQLGILPWGLSMGQTLSAPMIVAGLYFILTAKNRPVVIAPPEPDGKPA